MHSGHHRYCTFYWWEFEHCHSRTVEQTTCQYERSAATTSTWNSGTTYLFIRGIIKQNTAKGKHYTILWKNVFKTIELTGNSIKKYSLDFPCVYFAALICSAVSTRTIITILTFRSGYVMPWTAVFCTRKTNHYPMILVLALQAIIIESC